MSNSEISCIPRLSVFKVDSGFYGYEVSYLGQIIHEDSGYSSIAQAISDAIGSGPRVAGFEVAYDGYTGGTYTLLELTSEGERIAALLVQTKAKFVAY